ncbi:hypothetical protein [uncultured Erythrobacter sp.]|uniref:hypothetical protein n=1 Tax=uncultured Erythrobacter sp. TaxID=263913 RepID=UPI0026347CA0|nr:hypothetical protein [uncultured Erythrobacter sp.]
MTSLFLAAIAAPLALQAAAPSTGTAETPAAPAIASFDELPIEQSAAPRCAIAFAVVSRWQKAGDARGAPYDDMETNGGREFFVQSLAALMEQAQLQQGDVLDLAFAEVDKLDNADGALRVEAMMPACLLMKEAAGL